MTYTFQMPLVIDGSKNNELVQVVDGVVWMRNPMTREMERGLLSKSQEKKALDFVAKYGDRLI